MEIGEKKMETTDKTRRDFLNLWLSKTEHDLEYRAFPSEHRLFSRNLSDIERFVTAHMHENLFFGVNSRKGGGKKEHVQEVPCLYADMDFKQYAGGEQEAYERLKAFRYAPSIVIHSGNGLHVYWFLKEAEEPSGKIESILRGIAQALQSDSSVAELARILRIPGTVNYKNGQKKPVKIVQWTDQEYNLSDFEDFAIEDAGSTTKKVERQTVEEINAKCAFMKHAYQNTQLPEPLWYSMTSNLARLPEGVDLCHEYSQGYSGYNKRETDTKILHAINTPPHTCRHIKQNGFTCGKDCGVKSPVVKLRKTSETPRIDLSNTIANLTPETMIENLQEILKNIATLPSESEKNIYINLLAKKTGIGKRSLNKDLPDNNGKSEYHEQKSFSANFPGLVDLAVDTEGKVVFLIQEKGTLTRYREKEIDGVTYSPPDKSHLPFLLPREEEVFKHYRQGDDETLFDDVLSYLKRFAYQEDRYWLILAVNVFQTYLQDHPDIQYIAMILFYASPERGKSRTGKAMITIAYRGIHVVDLREANLFRYSQDLQATVFFDLFNLWKKAERNQSEDVLLLRYEKGARVARVLYPDKGAFQDTKYFSVYGATIIATNEALHNILDTRCIPITIPNKPGNYENPTPDKGLELKERLTAWRARMIDKPLPRVDQIPGLQGRLWDISRPLLQICKIVAPEHFNELVNVLIDIAGQRVEDKKQSTEGQIVTILQSLLPEKVSDWIIKVSDILEKFNEGRPEGYKKTSQWLGRKLKGMGIKTRHVQGKSEALLYEKEFEALKSQFIFSQAPEETRPNPTKPSEQGISTVSTGRELAESEQSLPKVYQGKTLDNQQSLGLVESGRELDKVLEEKNNLDDYIPKDEQKGWEHGD